LRILVIGTAFELSAIERFSRATPLFEEEGNSCRFALLSNRDHPLFSDWPGTRSAFAANDYPIDSSEIYFSEFVEQRFDGKKTDGGRGVAKVFNSRETVLAIFDTNTPPDVFLFGGKSQSAL